MHFINFNFIKISAERKKAPEPDMTINSDINLYHIGRQNIGLDAEQIKNNEVLSFEFNLTVTYENKKKEVIAFISFSGVILAQLLKKQAEDLLKNWKKKKVPDEIRVPLFNLIFSKCNTKALAFEEELALPYHIPMPYLTITKNEQESSSLEQKTTARPHQQNQNSGNNKLSDKNISQKTEESKRDYIG